MPLEATMIIIDNSEYMRNGDYNPTRLRAQEDAVNVVFTNKTNANAESMVGVMTMAGKSPEVLVTPTTDLGKVLNALHETKVGGQVDIQTSIQVAQLALKHRQNKNQRQRIIVFLGSPLGTSEGPLIRLAKKLKKSNVAVDIISFGEEEENEPVLRAFIDAVQSGDNSHLLSVPAGPHLLSDLVLSSPILAGEEGIPGGMDTAGGSGSGAGGQDFEFGVDPSLDPELAMALRMSLEEERARQAGSSGAPTAPAAAAASSTTLSNVPEVPTANMIPIDMDDDEDAMLQQALLLSQAEADGGAGAGAGEEDDGDVEMDADDEEENEEEAIARAIEMSMKSAEEESKDSNKPKPK
ncbi:hypothetical protein BOTBODRAFT_33007 [Botryobasidium botryosum FD-172 SS1]|uniref:VWFA domain-containing protein n=1 Tax=Botryobasidium botryosum (strain FD-172 SS1) TaxID=930990 RepID=A0A067MEM0_BOTB1|nr:hypothetical protein BOTBODRAFT_33007 [Botryobasidium botryosum FD-172 SS1]